MSDRRKARQAALQLLYQVELEGDRTEEGLARAWEVLELGPESSRGFAERLVRGTIEDLQQIDESINEAADNWQLDRISRVDLSILRVAVEELLREQDVPSRVIVDEAMEVAKRFSGERSASFINGVLDRIARRLGRGFPPL